VQEEPREQDFEAIADDTPHGARGHHGLNSSLQESIGEGTVLIGIGRDSLPQGHKEVDKGAGGELREPGDRHERVIWGAAQVGLERNEQRAPLRGVIKPNFQEQRRVATEGIPLIHDELLLLGVLREPHGRHSRGREPGDGRPLHRPEKEPVGASGIEGHTIEEVCGRQSGGAADVGERQSGGELVGREGRHVGRTRREASPRDDVERRQGHLDGTDLVRAVRGEFGGALRGEFGIQRSVGQPRIVEHAICPEEGRGQAEHSA